MGKLDKFFKRVARTNAAFKKASRAEKRIMVARDVIAALRGGQFEAEKGTYLHGGYDKDPETNFNARTLTTSAIDDRPDGSFREELKNFQKCNVCAKGALFTSIVARRNQVKNADMGLDIWYGPDLSKALGGIFSGDQLDLIEDVFEHWNRPNGEDDKTWMTAIMQNIIDHKGKFKPDGDPKLDRDVTHPNGY